MNNASLIQFEKTAVCPMASGRHIIRTEVKERCFIYQSFGLVEAAFGDKMLKPHVSFLADNGDGSAAEWEPQYGPIQIWTECPEDWEGRTEHGNEIKPRQHWHFPFVEDTSLNWSQLAVEREGLKAMLVDGNLDGVFGVLMRWADH